jgi:hypothetical protein
MGSDDPQRQPQDAHDPRGKRTTRLSRSLTSQAPKTEDFSGEKEQISPREGGQEELRGEGAGFDRWARERERGRTGGGSELVGSCSLSLCPFFTFLFFLPVFPFGWFGHVLLWTLSLSSMRGNGTNDLLNCTRTADLLTCIILSLLSLSLFMAVPSQLT